MKSIEYKFVTPVTGIYTLRCMCIVVVCVLFSACATTNSNQAAQSSLQSKQAVKSRCMATKPVTSDAKTNAKTDGKTAENSQQNCLPKGVIEITENYPVDPEVNAKFKQAVELLKQEKYPEAILLLRAVTGSTSKFTGPYIDLGIAYARSGDLVRAEKSLKKALEINPNHPVAMNELGLVYRKTGRYKLARALYEKLLREYPDFLPAHKNFGVLCDIYIQDLPCALDQYHAYLKGYPDDKKVKIWVADVKSRM